MFTCSLCVLERWTAPGPCSWTAGSTSALVACRAQIREKGVARSRSGGGGLTHKALVLSTSRPSHQATRLPTAIRSHPFLPAFDSETPQSFLSAPPPPPPSFAPTAHSNISGSLLPSSLNPSPSNYTATMLSSCEPSNQRSPSTAAPMERPQPESCQRSPGPAEASPAAPAHLRARPRTLGLSLSDDELALDSLELKLKLIQAQRKLSAVRCQAFLDELEDFVGRHGPLGGSPPQERGPRREPCAVIDCDGGALSPGAASTRSDTGGRRPFRPHRSFHERRPLGQGGGTSASSRRQHRTRSFKAATESLNLSGTLRPQHLDMDCIYYS